MCDATFRATMVKRAAALAFCGLLAACGGGGGGGSDSGGGPISLSPATATVPVGGQVPFTLSSPASTTWSVDGLEGGNGAVGTISPVGVYTAPFVLPSLSTAILPSPSTTVPPSPLTVTVSASAASNTASVTVVSRFVDGGAVLVETCALQCLPSTPNAVVAADFNRDNRSDLVTANSGSGTISVLVAGPSDTFSTPRTYLVGNLKKGTPQAVVADILNADTNVDVAVADADPTGLAVRTRLGNGDGTLQDERFSPLPAPSDPLSMVSGHFNNDTILDVVVANFTTSTVAVMQGTGTGGFEALPTILLSSEARPLGIAATDLNRDGFDDFAVANSGDGTVAVFLNGPSGVLQLAQTLAISGFGGSSAVVATDLNNDSYADLVVTAVPDNLMTVILNQGTSGHGLTFSPSSLSYQTYTTGPRPVAMASGDWNKDENADLVVVNRDDNTVTVFLGYGDGTLVNSETYPVGNAPQSVAVGDFNGDSFPDLAVANSGDDTVSILRNRGQ